MLTGTPSTEQTATEHTYTVTDSASTPLTVTLTFTITVNAAGTPTFMGTIEDQVYTQDAAIMNLVLPSATGGMGPYMYTLTPALPMGLSFDPASRTLSGTPTVDAAIATHTYTVIDSTAGTALTASLTFTITVNEAETTFGIGSRGAAVHVYPNRRAMCSTSNFRVRESMGLRC